MLSENIAGRERGISAKSKGRKLGRKAKEMPEGFEEVCIRCMNGEISARVSSEILGMSYSTFYRHYRKFTEEK